MSPRLTALLFTLALAVRLAYIATLAPQGFALRDGWDYDLYAREILSGEGYPVTPALYADALEGLLDAPVRRTVHPFIRPPLFPYFLAGVYAVFGPGNLTAVRVLQALLDSGTTVLVALVASTLGGPIGAAAAGGLAAIYPHLVVHTSYIGTESLFTFLQVLLVWLLVRGVNHPLGIASGALLGLLAGLAALCRPLFVPLMVALLAWVSVWGASTWRRRLRAAAAATLVASVVLTGWSLDNWRRSGEWYLFDGSGLMFFLGNNPAYERVVAAAGPAEYWTRVEILDRVMIGHLVQTEGMPLSRRSSHFVREGLRYIADNPGAWAVLELKKVWHLWRPWVNPLTYDWPALVATGVAFGLVEALGVAGLVLAWRQERCRPCVVLILLFIVVGTAVQLATIVQVRYRVPLVDPYLIAAGGVTVARAVQRCKPGPAGGSPRANESREIT